MKKTFFIVSILTVNIFSSTLEELIKLSESNPSIKALNYQAKSYDSLYDAAKSYNYPSLDLSYTGTFLQDKPVVYLPASFGGGSWQMQSKNTYVGALTLSYPLFSGFAISSQIDQAKLQKQKALLKVEDAKRNLYLNIVEVYSLALSVKHIIDSQKITLKATQDSYKKAKGFFDAGMSSSSELYRIEALLHEVKSGLAKSKNQYKILLSQLSFMANSEITDVNSLPDLGYIEFEKLKKEALNKRPDLRSIKLLIKEAKSKIDLAKSSYYPSVSLYAQAAYAGDTTSLDGDGYTNKNKSSAGFKINYNLFSGLKDHSQIEAAREAKLSSELMLKSYIDKVNTELYSSYLNFQSLQEQEKSAKAQLKAQESYEKLVVGQFENQLSDADVLSRAISSSAMARASLINIQAQLYNAYAKLLLEVGNETFLSTLNK
jgi:outer membrane protein TolC